MKINCAKCGKHIANVVEPSAIKKGASLYGVCYECKNRVFHGRKKVEDFGETLRGFMDGFAHRDR